MKAIFNKTPTTASVLFIVFVWLLMIYLALTMSSCTGKKGYIKYSQNHPEVLAKDCMEKFPPIETFKPGKIDTVPGKNIFIEGDSIPCPEQLPGERPAKVKAPDKYVQCPPSLICTPDTITKIDSACIYLLNGAKIKIADHEQTIKELKKDKLWLTISGALLFLLTCLFVFLWIRKK